MLGWGGFYFTFKNQVLECAHPFSLAVTFSPLASPGQHANAGTDVFPDASVRREKKKC